MTHTIQSALDFFKRRGKTRPRGETEDRPATILGVDRIQRFRQPVVFLLSGGVGKDVAPE